MDKLAHRQRADKKDNKLWLVLLDKVILPVLLDQPQVQRGGLQHSHLRVDLVLVVPHPHKRLNPAQRVASGLGHGHQDNIIVHWGLAIVQIAELHVGHSK